jgi:hypothetical protein
MIGRRRGRGRAVTGPADEFFDPSAPADVLRRVVRPVVASVIRPHELEHLAVGRMPGHVDRRVLLVAVQACGESWTMPIWPEEAPERTNKEVAARLGDQLEDWLCVTRFAWGERRRAVADVAPQ